MILAGDVGGTKARLALYDIENSQFIKRETETFATGEFEGLNEILHKFLSRTRASVERACLGVPGPVVRGAAQATNLPWVLDESNIQDFLGLQLVKLVNDLGAVAAAVPHLSEEDLVVLHEGKPPHCKPTKYGVLAPGTGLGQSFLYEDDVQSIVLSSEGGHGDFAPTSEEEVELLRYLQAEFGRVSYERLLSGPGLENIYRFLRDTGYAEEPRGLAEQLKKGVPAAVISGAGLIGEDKLCVKALDLFASILGAQAGNLVLTFLATGGIYLGGGIPPKICEKLKDGATVGAFLAKGRLSSLVEHTPLYVIRDEHTALLGAASLASKL